MPRESALRSAGGFTLVEAIVALSLSTLLVMLVTSVFMAQSDFYDDVVRRSDAHHETRSVTDLVGVDVRRTTPEGIIQADSLIFAAQVPVGIALVCELNFTYLSVFYPETDVGLDTLNVTGYGVRDGGGGWFFNPATWSDLYYDSGTNIKDACGAAGVDTTGVPASNFVQLYGPWPYFSRPPAVGDPFLLVRRVELEFSPSELDSGTVALYRGTYGDTLIEYASGLGDGSHFRYRLQGDSVFYGSVEASNFDLVNAVRVVARAYEGAGSNGETYDFSLIQDVPLRNEP